MTIVAEIHGSLNAPEHCLENHPYDAGAYRWLATLWFSDREVADWVETTYGAPTHFGEFELVQDANPTVLTHTWSWRVPDGEWSHVTMRDVAIQDDYPDGFTEWWFWFNGNGISYMDAAMTFMADDTSAPLIDGHMAAPMMFATASGQGAYAAVADWFPEQDLDGAIRRFGDLECASPL